MKIQALYDLHQEINRLFIASSKFARNDPRLTKYIPVLDKMGEKAPVFKKLAQDVTVLTQIESSESADKLLNLSTLLYSVLYTQGEMIEAVDPMVLTPVVDVNEVRTTESYLKLNPLIEALTTSIQGRMRILEDGFQQGLFRDLRTFGYTNRALGDKYTELADFIEDSVIPSLGSKILPLLKSTISYEGRPEDIRRFRILHASKYPGLEEMIPKILAESSVNMQAEAVRVLGDDLRNEPQVLVLADDKHKPVREAAYMALAGYNTPESRSKLFDLFLKNKNKGDLERIAAALKTVPVFNEAVFDKVRTDFEACATLDKDMDHQALHAPFEKLRTELNALYEKQDERILPFFEEILTHKNFNAIVSFRKSIQEHIGQAIGLNIARNLEKIGTPGLHILKRLADNAGVMKVWGSAVVPNYFMACARTYSPDEMYTTFARYYPKYFDASVFLSSFAKGETHFVLPLFYRMNTDYQVEIDFDRIDKRWVDLFSERAGKDEEALFLAVSCDLNNKKVQKVLFEQLKDVIKKRRLPDNFFFLMEKAAEANITAYRELVMASFECARNLYAYQSTHCIYQNLKKSPVLKQFPRSFEARFRKLYEQTNVDELNEIADLVADNPA